MSSILEIRHVEQGPYVLETRIIWNGPAPFSVADDAARCIEAAEEEGGLDTLLSKETINELEHDARMAREEAEEAQGRIEELEEDVADAEAEKAIAEDECAEALDKLDGFMNNAGWKVERERKFEELTSDSMALNTLCRRLHDWAGRSKAKADVLRFIEAASAQIKARNDEIAEKYKGREPEERKAA